MLRAVFFFGIVFSLSITWGATVKESLRQVQASPDYVQLKPSDGLAIDLRYGTPHNFVGRDMYGDFKFAYLHKKAGAMLVQAIQNLQKEHPGYKLLIFDALRPRSVQRILWEKVVGTDQEQYVANPDRGSVHNFGFAVDLSVTDDRGQELDMGTPFDSFLDLAQPKLEDKFLKQGRLTETQLRNRKILRSAMTAAGFLQLPHEWWHYDALPGEEVRAKYKIVE